MLKRNNDQEKWHFIQKETANFRENMSGSINPMLVLRILCDGPNYAYQIRQILEKKTDGVYAPLLYPVLKRLNANGFVKQTESLAEGGHLRKMYVITDLGRFYLAQLKAEYDKANQYVDSIMDDLTFSNVQDEIEG